MPIPRKVTVLIDNREKHPVFFPATVALYPDRSGYGCTRIRIEQRTVRLGTADYLLLGYEHCCGIERKASIRELFQNLLTNDYDRFQKSIIRLRAQCSHPYLVLESSLSDLTTATPHVPNPDLVMDALLAFCAHRNLPLLLVGRCATVRSRTALGAFLVRLMLRHALETLEPEPSTKGTNP